MQLAYDHSEYIHSYKTSCCFSRAFLHNRGKQPPAHRKDCINMHYKNTHGHINKSKHGAALMYSEQTAARNRIS